MIVNRAIYQQTVFVLLVWSCGIAAAAGMGGCQRTGNGSDDVSESDIDTGRSENDNDEHPDNDDDDSEGDGDDDIDDREDDTDSDVDADSNHREENDDEDDEDVAPDEQPVTEDDSDDDSEEAPPFDISEIEKIDECLTQASVVINNDESLREVAPYTCIKGSLTINNYRRKNFQLPYLEEVTGRLSITNCDEIIDLTSLTSLKKVGALQIGGFRTKIVYDYEDYDTCDHAGDNNCAKWEELNDIREAIYPDGNRSLVTLDGLQQLTEIDGSLTISDNEALENLVGLENVVRVGGDIRIGETTEQQIAFEEWDGYEEYKLVEIPNISLSELNGLSNLRTVGSNVHIVAPVSSEFSAFQNLEEVGGNLRIISAAKELDGFHQLQSVGRTLELRMNALEKLDGFSALTTVDDVLIVESSALSDISSLANLTSAQAIVVDAPIASISAFENLTHLQALVLVNAQIEDLSALPPLPLVALEMASCPNLTSLSEHAFDSLKRLMLDNNPLLTDLQAVSEITALKDLMLSRLGITSLKDFSNLTEIENGLWLTGNSNLTTTADLVKLESADSVLISGPSYEFQSVNPERYVSGTAFCSDSSTNFGTMLDYDLARCPHGSAVTESATLDTQDSDIALEVVDLPSLTSAPSMTSIYLHGLNNLTRISIPQIESVFNFWLVDSTLSESLTLDSLLGSTSFRLVEVNGNFELELPSLQAGTIDVQYCAELTGITLPAIEVTGGVTFENNEKLRTVDFPLLSDGGVLTVYDNPALETVSAPALKTLSELELHNNDNLSELDFSSLQAVTRGISSSDLSENPLLPEESIEFLLSFDN